MTQLPIFHINGDDPEAAYRALQIALDYRQEFNKDVVLDVVGFRKLGPQRNGRAELHAAADVRARQGASRSAERIYAKRLIKEGVIDEAELNEMLDRAQPPFGSCAGARQRGSGRRNPRATGRTTDRELDGSANRQHRN